MMFNMLTWVLYLALYIFLHRVNYLPAVMLLLRPGKGMKLALLVYYVYCKITSEAVNIIHNIHSVLFVCPSLGCYIWVFLNNDTQPLGVRVETGFFRPFRPDMEVFEIIEFFLDVKDGIILLVLLCLLCTACTMYTMLGNTA